MRHHGAWRPLAKVALDHLGKLPSAVGGECFILVAIDVYTKYVIAQAIDSQKGVHVKNFIASFCSHFGVQTEIVTDNSLAFCNQDVLALTQLLGIKHTTAVPRYSRGNAVVERE